jgi:hypothetical protein
MSLRAARDTLVAVLDGRTVAVRFAGAARRATRAPSSCRAQPRAAGPVPLRSRTGRCR